MADLFALEDLNAYTQTVVPTNTATLVRALAAALIRAEVGAARYDALTDLTPLQPVALDVARRMLANPGGMRSETIGAYSVTYASETLAEAGLTDTDREQIAAALGLSPAGAFTVRPSGWTGACRAPQREWP